MTVTTIWTPASVEERLIAAFRDPPSHPVLSRRSGQIEAGLSDELAGVDLIALAEHVLPNKPTCPTYLRALLTWARCKAGQADASINDICREAGWSRDTFDRRRKRAAELVAGAASNGATTSREPQAGAI